MLFGPGPGALGPGSRNKTLQTGLQGIPGRYLKGFAKRTGDSSPFRVEMRALTYCPAEQDRIIRPQHFFGRHWPHFLQTPAI